MLQAFFLLLIYFRVGSADSEGSGPDDTGPVGTDLVVIVDTGPTGSGLRDLDSVDTGPTGLADTGLADIGLADSGPAGTGPVHPGPADRALTRIFRVSEFPTLAVGTSYELLWGCSLSV